MALGSSGLLQSLVNAAENISDLCRPMGQGESCSVVHQQVTALSLVAVLLEHTSDTREEKG